MPYKKLFLTTLAILGLILFTFIIVPLCCGYSIGFLAGYQTTIEAVYYISSVAVAIAVALFTYKIYKKQLALMKKQAEIAKEQTAISKKQTEIMQQQNKIALFEKRCSLLNLLDKLIWFSCVLEENILGNITEEKEYFVLLNFTFGLEGETLTMAKCYCMQMQFIDQIGSACFLYQLDEYIVFEKLIVIIEKTFLFYRFGDEKFRENVHELHEVMQKYIAEVKPLLVEQLRL